jgi:hypothetical protein
VEKVKIIVFGFRINGMGRCFNIRTKPSKGTVMIGEWPYIVGAILFLISGCVCLFINSYWGLSLAYIVSLPIFAIGVIIVWRSKRKPPSS